MNEAGKEAALLPVRSNAGLGDAESIIENLYRARQKAQDEKREWRLRAAELTCLSDTSVNGTCACYYVEHDDQDKWCDNCRSKTLHRSAYHAASAASGAALNAVLRAGKKLASPNVKLTRRPLLGGRVERRVRGFIRLQHWTGKTF